MIQAANRVRIALPLAMVLCGVTCASLSQPVSARDVPAYVIEPDARSRAALQAAVSRALKRDYIRLADDALTNDSELIVEPGRVRDSEGSVIYDREPRVLEHFRLVKLGYSCYLVREMTGERFKLAHTRCARKLQ